MLWNLLFRKGFSSLWGHGALFLVENLFNFFPHYETKDRSSNAGGLTILLRAEGFSFSQKLTTWGKWNTHKALSIEARIESRGFTKIKDKFREEQWLSFRHLWLK